MAPRTPPTLLDAMSNTYGQAEPPQIDYGQLALAPGVYPDPQPQEPGVQPDWGFQIEKSPPWLQRGYVRPAEAPLQTERQMEADPQFGGDPRLGGVLKSTGGPAAAPAPLDFKTLMQGLPMTQGGGGGSRTVTNAILAPGEVAGFRSRLGEATETEKSAQGEKSAIASAMYRDQAAMTRESNSAQAAMLKAHEAKQAELDARVEAQMADNAKVMQEIKATKLIDPTAVKGEFKNRIAIMLGGFAQAGATMAGRNAPNVIEQQINADIKQKLQVQVAELANKKYVYEAGRNMVADIYKRTGDLQRSFLLGRGVYLDIAKAEMDAITKDAQSAEAVQLGTLAQAGLDKAQVQNEMQLKQLGYKRITTETKWGGGTATPAANMAAQLVMQQRLAAAGYGGGAAAGVGKQLPAKVALGIGEALAFRKNLGLLETDYLEEKAKTGHALKATLGAVFGTRASVLEKQLDGLAASLRKMNETGVMTDKDYDRYRPMLPTIWDTVGSSQAKFQLLKRAYDVEFGGKLSGLAKSGWDVSQHAGAPPVVPAQQPLKMKAR